MCLSLRLIHPTTLARLSCLVRYKHAVECIKWEKDDKGEEWVLSLQTTKRWDWKAVQGREDSYISHEGWKRRRAEKWSEIRIINIGWCWKLPRKFVIFYYVDHSGGVFLLLLMLPVPRILIFAEGIVCVQHKMIKSLQFIFLFYAEQSPTIKNRRSGLQMNAMR